MKKRTLVLVVFGLFAASCVHVPPAPEADTAGPHENAIVRLTNAVRTRPAAYAEGLLARHGARKEVAAAVRALRAARPQPPLRASRGMTEAAADHVADTGPRGLVGHRGRDGSDVGERLNRYGRALRAWGENISYGQPDAQAVVDQLVLSEGHRANLLNARFGRIGVACGPHARYRMMCVQTFAGAYQEAGAAVAEEVRAGPDVRRRR